VQELLPQIKLPSSIHTSCHQARENLLEARNKVNTSLQEEANKIPQHAALPAPDFPTITELEKFDLKTAEPIKLRPFKPQYHLTMGKDPIPSPIHSLHTPTN
jgi:hypothetical protein